MSTDQNNTEENTSQENTVQEKRLRKIRSFVLREGRMTPGQQRGLDTVFPKYGRSVEQGAVELDQWFARSGSQRVLEIGFGMGASLLEMAQAEPDVDFIGIEVHKPGVGHLLNDAIKADVTNLRVYAEDAVEVLNQCIADQSIDRLQLYFPDPWHKKRHNKRRIVQPEFVQTIRNKLKIGGQFHLATDWENYAEHMMEVMEVAEGYVNNQGEKQYTPRPDWRPLTKFENRGHRLGHGVWDLIYRRES
ncbi:tRNA (guanosine(46)-N7)-methyltransferase TrmB [Pelagibaculum spongiae]|uniref:tRNA (guanine-N(7)-)-methyltransferase n=1 Tax=Pelagibaculum spongiae TaxID=2080658 RepID=A0A2V1GS00_9GAMM|nr:tRNA (guanosine(46)-N7)-methyltransferase TrmB [Pelagibaculum spongiae]PVZ63577.1 tRNA (guanosine(46)-N7)-methyltransferase TrmB [Pelagibaculum spongiae]